MAVGIAATRGRLAKSLLGNRFVGQPPPVRGAAADVGGSQSAATPSREG